MNSPIPEFPCHDRQVKVIALLGYTGVGKTSLITAGYFEHIMHGKDAFTQRFFQRIEEEIQEFGTIPLTLGEASTLNFIEPQSRTEFTVQDFSGEHIKLERKDNPEYQELISRADNSHALICMLSASNFYRSSRIYEEVDAIQTFVNKLRGLGARIPVVVVLTKCDTVPRFYVDLPLLKWVCSFFSHVPFLKLPAERGLDLTRRRFPTIFSGLNFKGKGPCTVFLGLALPRLKRLKPWRWPQWMLWFAKIFRRMLIDPKWLFRNNYQLQSLYNFCFQSFQLSMLRDSLVRHHQENAICEQILQKFSQTLIDGNLYGKEFYFKEYFDRILEDTRSLIEEMEREIESLKQSASRLLVHERDLGQNLRVWLDSMEESLRKFRKPWSEGAKQTLESLRHSTLCSVRDRLQEFITQALQETTANTFYRVVDILRLRRNIADLPVWSKEEIVLPDVESFQNRLLEHLVFHTLSRTEVPLAIFQEDRDKFLEVLTITPPTELTMLERMVDAASVLEKNIGQYQSGSGRWGEEILAPFKSFEQEWAQLARKFDLPHECPFRQTLEKKIIVSLEKEAQEFKSLSQVLEWSAEAEQSIHCPSSREKIKQVGEIAAAHSRDLLAREMEQLVAKSKKWQGTGKLLPTRLKEWFEESRKKRETIQHIAGSKGLEAIEQTEKKVLEEVVDYLHESIKRTLEGSEKAGAFIELLEMLHIYNEIEKLDFFSAYGMTLPHTGDVEKSLFRNLVLMMIQKSAVHIASYQEDRTRFLSVIRGSEPPYLKPLDTLVASFDKAHKGAKEMASLPDSEWENRILDPMRLFHQSWLELTGSLPLPEEPPLKKEMERVVVRSLEEQVRNLALNRLRDWIGMLYPLLQIGENRAVLDKILQETENDIRVRFQKDLNDFIAQCKSLSESSRKLDKKSAQKAQEAWRHFSGSMRALSYSSERFPKTELSFDEKTKHILEYEAPEQLKACLEEFLRSLSDQKLLRKKMCTEMAESVSQIKTIFNNPESFYGITETLQAHLASFKERRTLCLRMSIAAFFLLAVGIAFLGVRCHMRTKIRKTQEFSLQNFARPSEIHERWQRLREFPSWLFFEVDSEEITRQMLHYQWMAYLSQVEERISKKEASLIELREYQKRLRDLFLSPVGQESKIKIEELLLDARSLSIIVQLEKESVSKGMMEELDELKETEKGLRSRVPSFKSYLLEEALRLYERKSGQK